MLQYNESVDVRSEVKTRRIALHVTVAASHVTLLDMIYIYLPYDGVKSDVVLPN